MSVTQGVLNNRQNLAISHTTQLSILGACGSVSRTVLRWQHLSYIHVTQMLMEQTLFCEESKVSACAKRSASTNHRAKERRLFNVAASSIKSREARALISSMFL